VAGHGSAGLAHPARWTLRSERLRRAVFLDRDGTLIEVEPYLSDPKRVVLLPGTAAALSDLRDAGFMLVVVTNQSGIARGLFSEDGYHAMAKRLDDVLAEAGSPVDATMFCPHHPDFGPACQCRKPATGMYRQAAAELGLNLADSYYVGDRVRDVAPARELGGVGVLVRTGYGADEAARVPAGTAVVDDLGGAARLILSGAQAGGEETLTPPEGSGNF
jgi:D-glycero-D-manno-heptose 1,7-bisphosphate phosphatase